MAQKRKIISDSGGKSNPNTKKPESKKKSKKEPKASAKEEIKQRLKEQPGKDEFEDSGESEEDTVPQVQPKKTVQPLPFRPRPDDEDEESEEEPEDIEEKENKEDLFMSDDELDAEVPKDIIPVGNSKQKSKGEKADNEGKDGLSNVIYLGRVPYGFFEEQMKGYFSQFGTVTRLRLSRNKKTAKSKHYAFIEFETSEIAQIAAGAMHDYLLYGHRLQCKVVPTDKLHPDTFKGANRKFKKIPYRTLTKQKHNKEKNATQVQKTVRRLLSKEEKKRKKLKELGIEYDFQGYGGSNQTKKKAKVK